MDEPIYKKVALLGLLTALGMVLGYVEMLIPVEIIIPGAKLGLGNLVTIVAIKRLKPKDVFLLTFLRVTLVAATFGNMAAFFYSISGGILSAATMIFINIGKRFFDSPIKLVNA